MSTNAIYINIPAAGVLTNNIPPIMPNRQSTEDNKL